MGVQRSPVLCFSAIPIVCDQSQRTPSMQGHESFLQSMGASLVAEDCGGSVFFVAGSCSNALSSHQQVLDELSFRRRSTGPPQKIKLQVAGKPELEKFGRKSALSSLTNIWFQGDTLELTKCC